MLENTDQNNSEYGHFSGIARDRYFSRDAGVHFDFQHFLPQIFIITSMHMNQFYFGYLYGKRTKNKITSRTYINYFKLRVKRKLFQD